MARVMKRISRMPEDGESQILRTHWLCRFGGSDVGQQFIPRIEVKSLPPFNICAGFQPGRRNRKVWFNSLWWVCPTIGMFLFGGEDRIYAVVMMYPSLVSWQNCLSPQDKREVDGHPATDLTTHKIVYYQYYRGGKSRYIASMEVRIRIYWRKSELVELHRERVAIYV